MAGERYTGEFRDGERVGGTPEPFGPGWIVAENQVCQVWNYGQAEKVEPLTWSGNGMDGKASGEGPLTASCGDTVYDGAMRDGRLDGRAGASFMVNWRLGC